jgi:transcriptional regulator with PAS, ATPase and Fis domain
MKSIAVITDSAFKCGRPSTTGNTIKSNILAVFGDNVAVSVYYLDQLSEKDSIPEDLVILMAGSRGIKVRKHVVSNDNVIVARRTFLKNGIYPLFSIPNGSEVLVVNDDIETVLDSISSLYHIGVKHVNLIPFEAEKDYSRIRYAVSPSEPELVPDYIPEVYDLGNRVVDIPTMLLISTILHINDKETQRKLYNYNQEIFSPNEGIIENYTSLLTRTEELDQLLDLSHDGILLTDKEGKILIYNRRFLEIFDIRKKPEGAYLHDILSEAHLEKCYDKDFHDGLVSIGKKIINLEKKDVSYFNQEVRMYFSFQEVTHIKKLEQNLSRKLRQKGQIARYTFDDILFSTPDMQIIIDKAQKIAVTDLTILITGESGTGKEILAQAIHNASPRRHQPFIAINSAAIPDTLIESELFGYVSGSFTGALRGGKQGLFEKANNGTVFLDEIGDMPGHLQSKLLRVLQERQITPIGSDRIIDIDIRVIAATHKSPGEMIESGIFRKDLFYRLNVFPLELPALRERKEDIPVLLRKFTGGRFSFTEECLNLLSSYPWPGNIRELNNIAQYISILEENGTADLRSLPFYIIRDFESPAKKAEILPFGDERLLLEQKTGLDPALQVLKAIRGLNRIGKTAGRKHIMQFPAQPGSELQESRLRNILSDLRLAGLIITGKGRSGSCLTEKGCRFLSEMEKQDILQVN